GEKVAVFLTLQDLQGDLIKEKHEDIFRNKIDLLIVDETHFGARAENYGKILENTKYEKDIKDIYQKEKDTIDDLNKNLKILNVDMTLHLSGTPYRILMGSEFEKEDIISFCQFSDIVEEQEKWNSNNILSDNVKEWDNPYFGFPQMVRFAFNPSKKAKEKLKEYQKNGYTYAFSALFKPQSIKKSNKGFHKKFINEQEILELLEVIDGSKEDENVLGFLNYDKIKQGKMCRHIVCVLPYCASCDALEELIKTKKDTFKNLNNYKIINISGVENNSKYKTIEKIKDEIKKCEDNNIKTLTLTVNRMLTGSTVEQWDTMIYLKDTSSPQEYDQAIFRLQNQYIKKYVDKDNNVIKYNMKPQTLLVDFDPYRMFKLQEQKSKIYNVNIEESGNSLLEERLKNELKVSPIITMNKNKIVEIEPKNIMDAVSEYSKERGVMDEVNDIPVD
ncbi:MAG: restriction endonuclease, partial [Oscillospiraceae bacterium]|nr:restriction endonuclease [Oscillospiraceae bacterium]